MAYLVSSQRSALRYACKAVVTCSVIASMFTCSGLQADIEGPGARVPAAAVFQSICDFSCTAGLVAPGQPVFVGVATGKALDFLALQTLTAREALGPEDFEYEEQLTEAAIALSKSARPTSFEGIKECNLKPLEGPDDLQNATDLVIFVSIQVENPFTPYDDLRHGHFVRITFAGGAPSSYWMPVSQKSRQPLALVDLDVHE